MATWSKAQVIRALGRAGITGGGALIDEHGLARVVDVGRAYRMAKEEGAASSSGWVARALREGWDVTYYLELWREAEEAKQQRAYLARQGEKARALIEEFDRARTTPPKSMPTRKERFKPLDDYLAQPGGMAALEAWKTCRYCEADPCSCPASDVLLRARAKASALKPLIEERAVLLRRKAALDRQGLFAPGNIKNLLEA